MAAVEGAKERRANLRMPPEEACRISTGATYGPFGGAGYMSSHH
jgi:hypothetical protein